MANARALAKRRKSIRNIRKITRTMELIATARFKKAMDRAVAATDYTRRIEQIVRSLAASGLTVQHPLLEPRPVPKRAVLLVLTANRGLCGGFNGNLIRAGMRRLEELKQGILEVGGTRPADSAQPPIEVQLEIAGKRGISGMKFRGATATHTFTQFEDKPRFDEVEGLANRYLDGFIHGSIDRLEVVYMAFRSISKQQVVTETLLPMGGIDTGGGGASAASVEYEFLPSAASILEEIVPTSFKNRLFKCFLDSAVSEQIARMVAMKSATENAGDLIKSISTTYNRARQSQITNQIMEIIGGVEALAKK